MGIIVSVYEQLWLKTVIKLVTRGSTVFILTHAISKRLSVLVYQLKKMYMNYSYVEPIK